MKLVFLDRDGVINEFPGNGNYVTKVKDFRFIPGALEAIRWLTQDGYRIFVISNQAGISKGVFTKDKLDRITKKMLVEVEKKGGRIEKVFYAISRSTDNCEFRKPNIGAIRLVMRTLNKSIRSARHAFFIGDTEIDIQAGHNAGCKTIFVLSGREDQEYLRRKWKTQPDFIAKDLWEAAKVIHAVNSGQLQVRHKKRKRS